ncbi:MAG: TraB/GumN family protein [Sphaerochaetaceae bacterium]|jgi:pheromone shutdown-related protein TraB|nr:TraB/GumN family protein [Sphaerochaetaceae bacterium]NLV84626.1 TraB/GumN family protein [Spirochaetales bacterium]
MLTIEKTSGTRQTISCSDGRRITLVGTAHVSQHSVDEVAQAIEEINPDRICVELDEGRYNSRINDKGWEDLNLKTIFKQNKGFLMLANMALSSYQKRLGNQTGVKPGDEIMSAITIAKEKQIPFSLCDREIQVTFKRAWRLSSFWNKMKLISVLISAIFSNEEMNDEDLEKLKENDILQSMLEEMAKELPTIKKVLIDERDQYLASSIYSEKGNNIVAVVGAGHVPGLVAHLEKLDSQKISPDTTNLEFVPKASSFGKIFSWLIVIALLGIIAIGFIRTGWEGGLEMFLYWFALNATLTGVAAIATLAHPVTIILSMLAAPITALSPTLGVGMVAGILEVTLRKPRVKDFEHLTDDIVKFKKWFSNRILHAFAVFMSTSILASIGTFIAFPLLINKLRVS